MDEHAQEKKRIAQERKQIKQDDAAHKKEVKKRAKELSKQQNELEEEEEGGGFVTFLATLAIILVWIGIIIVVIKLDVGGFGSNVLAPVLRDVPVLNKILPKSAQLPSSTDSSEELASSEFPVDDGGFNTIEEAAAEVKRLQAELDAAKAEGLKQEENITALKAEVSRLAQFENRQVEFQRIKTEFFEDVVYADKGPGIEEYKKFYEAMDPATAEYLYKQVVGEVQEDQEFLDYAQSFSTSMKPAQAAAVLEQMGDNLQLVAKILSTLDSEARGKIMGVMTPSFAANVAKLMNPDTK